jgi:hypothetical protein
MASACKCDRCGAFYDPLDVLKPDFKQDGNKYPEAWRYTLKRDCHPYGTNKIDLCPACQVLLYKWVTEYDDLNKKRKD